MNREKFSFHRERKESVSLYNATQLWCFLPSEVRIADVTGLKGTFMEDQAVAASNLVACLLCILSLTVCSDIGSGHFIRICELLQ